MLRRTAKWNPAENEGTRIICEFLMGSIPLLADKAVPMRGVGLEKAVGLRLTFRQPPPIDCFSNQFLFYLNSTVADSAYQTWAHMTAEAPVFLPPERFHFQVHELKQ